MKKFFKIIYIGLFLMICFVPLAFMPFVKNDASLEKRELKPLPAYMKEGKLNVDFSTQFEEWFNDRIPFRPELLSAANALQGEMLHASTSNVIVGKEGWLYYDSESADYMNINPMSDAEINAAAITLSLIQENVEEKGGRFTFVPMPNKASVYDEYMPDRYRKAEENNLSRLTEEMDRVGVNYVDMKTLMLENKDKGVYHRRDSHWNYRGAMLGYNAIMDSLGREHKNYLDAPERVVKDWRGDLDKLLYPAGGVLDDQYYYDIDYDDFMFTYPATAGGNKKTTRAQLENFMSDKEEGDDTIKTRNLETGEGNSLFMARDSFGRALLPFMIDSYSEATFKRTDCPDVNSIGENTDFIYEIVERNLIRLSEKAPFMYAPVRGDGIPESENADNKVPEFQNAGEIDANYDVEGYGIRIYGAFPEEEPSGDGRVYIVLEKDGGSDSTVYEAFPIYEKELMEDKNENKSGFSAIIERTDDLSGNYNVKIVTGDKMYTGPVLAIN